MKVYLVFNGEEGKPEMKLKLTLPEKWLGGPVQKITEFFVEQYNKKYPESTLNVAEYELLNKNNILFPPQATCSSVVHEYEDLILSKKAPPKATHMEHYERVVHNVQPRTQQQQQQQTALSYNKWDKLTSAIDDSSDEEHPNIDKALLKRIHREKRERQRQEENELREKLLHEETEEAKRKLAELDKKKKFTLDELCTVKQDVSMVNHNAKEGPKVPVPGSKPEGEASESLFDFMEKHKEKAQQYGALSIDDSEDFLLSNTELLSDDACSHLLLYMLDLEMEGKTGDMKQVCRQYLMLRNIIDLTRQLPPGSDMRQVVRPFFMQIREKEKGLELARETEGFAQKIIHRAIEKKREAAEEAAEAGEGNQEETEEVAAES